MALDSVKIEKLEMVSGSTSYDIADFSCSWAINSIPQAQCRVILGQGVLGSSLNKEWENKDPGKVWSVSIKASSFSSEEQIFEGYIISVGQTEKLTAYGNKVSVLVTLAATPILLSMLQASAYVYWDNTVPDTTKAADGRPAVNVRSNALSEEVAGLFTNKFALDKIKELTGFDVALAAKDRLNQFLIGAAAYMHDSASAGDEDIVISDFFKTDRDVGFKPDATGEATHGDYKSVITVSLATSYVKRWTSNSVWAALVGTAKMFYLSIVPRREKLEIVPITPWLKEPNITISPNAVLGLTETTQMAKLLYSPDGVKVVSNLPSTKNAAKNEAAGIFVETYPEEVRGSAAKGKQVSVSLPYWAAKHLEREFKSIPVKTKKVPNKNQEVRLEDQKQNEVVKAESAEKDVSMKSACKEFAKLYYAQVKNADYSVAIKVPWNRFSLIDSLGYVAVVPDLSTFANRDSHSIYGMIQSVSLSISRSPTAGSAQMTVNLTHVRDKDTNDELALESNPFYSFDFDAESSSIGTQIGIKKSTELNLDSRLGPS